MKFWCLIVLFLVYFVSEEKIMLPIWSLMKQLHKKEIFSPVNYHTYWIKDLHKALSLTWKQQKYFIIWCDHHNYTVCVFCTIRRDDNINVVQTSNTNWATTFCMKVSFYFSRWTVLDERKKISQGTRTNVASVAVRNKLPSKPAWC